MISTRGALLEIHKLLEDPNRWTRGANARDANGEPTNPYGPDGPPAVCWCLSGAIMKVVYDTVMEAQTESGIALASDMRRTLLNRCPSPRLSVFNDDHANQHVDILALVGLAIQDKGE